MVNVNLELKLMMKFFHDRERKFSFPLFKFETAAVRWQNKRRHSIARKAEEYDEMAPERAMKTGDV